LLARINNKYRKLTVPRVLDIADTHESMLTTLNSYLRHYDCRGSDVAVCMNGHSEDTDYHLAGCLLRDGPARTTATW
jgi:hypothetical protein